MVVSAIELAGCSLFPTDNTSPGIDFCLTFTDLTAGSSYSAGDIIISSATEIEVGPFQWSNGTWTSSGSARVDYRGYAGGSGSDLNARNTNLHFRFPYPVGQITFRFGELGGNINMSVNGALQNVSDLIDLDGSIVAGVQVSVNASLQGNNWHGSVMLQGDIADFSIGGQELWLDDACSSSDSGPGPTSCTPRPWMLETLGSMEWGSTSVAVEVSGGVHLAYPASSGLNYARRGSASAWIVETVTPGMPGGESVISIDSVGGVHLGYLSGSSVGYAYRAPSGVWSLETVPAVSPHNTSLSVDAAGGVHLAYIEFSGRNLKYAYRAPSGVWSTETADASNNVSGGTSLAVDPMGGVHLSYIIDANSILAYAYKPSGGAWHLEQVEYAGGSPEGTSIVVDTSGGVHVVYNHQFEGLKYAYRSPAGNWVLEIADAQGRGAEVSIALDTGGGLHVSYYKGYPDGDLRYAYRPPSGPWSTETIDAIGWTGRFSSLASDQSGAIHVSYFESLANNLKYAYRCR